MQQFNISQLSDEELLVLKKLDSEMYRIKNNGMLTTEKLTSILIKSLLQHINELSGCLGMFVEQQYGGKLYRQIMIGNIVQVLAKYSPSMASLVIVHSMVTYSIQRWGNQSLKDLYLSNLASGKSIAAFALSEKNHGSDMNSIETNIEVSSDHMIINGEKSWISGSQLADICLCFGRQGDQYIACLVPLNNPGIRVHAITDMHGFSSAFLGTIMFLNCKVPTLNIIGNIGAGLTYIGNSALDVGRFCISWLSLGIINYCLAVSIKYVRLRKQFNKLLSQHQLIQAHLTKMASHWRSGKLQCEYIALLRDQSDFDSVMETNLTKYNLSKSASKVASMAIQIHGARGLTNKTGLSDYLLAAKVTELIEGSNEIQEILISNYVTQCWAVTNEEELCVV